VPAHARCAADGEPARLRPCRGAFDRMRGAYHESAVGAHGAPRRRSPQPAARSRIQSRWSEMKGRSLCPRCGKMFSFDAEFCPYCRDARVPGRGSHRVSLWYVTPSQFGNVFHPPGALNRQTRGASALRFEVMSR